MELVIMIAFAVAMGYWASTIKKKKNRDEASGWILGIFLGLIGVLICALQDTKRGTIDGDILDR